MTGATGATGAAAASSGGFISDIEIGAVDAISGIENIFGLAKSSIAASTTVATSGTTSSVVGNLVGGVENLVTGDGGAAVTAIEGFIADIQAGKWSNAPHDIVACLKAGFAILAKVGVNVPVVSTVVAELPNIPAVS